MAGFCLLYKGSPRFGDPRTASVTVAGGGDGDGGDGGGGDGGGVAVGVKVATLLSLDSLFVKSYAVITLY
jgi:hypothetical protein